MTSRSLLLAVVCRILETRSVNMRPVHSFLASHPTIQPTESARERPCFTPEHSLGGTALHDSTRRSTPPRTRSPPVGCRDALGSASDSAAPEAHCENRQIISPSWRIGNKKIGERETERERRANRAKCAFFCPCFFPSPSLRRTRPFLAGVGVPPSGSRAHAPSHQHELRRAAVGGVLR